MKRHLDRGGNHHEPDGHTSKRRRAIANCAESGQSRQGISKHFILKA